MSTTTLQQLIFNALHKAATPDGETPVFATSEEARDAYIALVMADLFPGAPVAAAKPKTKRAKRAAESPVVAAPMEVVAEAAPVEAAPVEAAPAKVKSPKTKKAKKAAEEPLPESPVVAAAAPESPQKKKRAPMTEEAKAAMKAKREATLAAKKQVDDLAGALGELTIAKEPNLKKMDPTWRKHLKTVAKANGKEVTKEMEAELLSYLNRFTAEEFGSKKAEEHVTEFLRPATASNAAAATPTDLDVVEFNGQDYFVNPETKRVYEGVGARDDDTGAYENYKPVGYVGMAAFADMKME
jgi:hypothetical protein